MICRRAAERNSWPLEFVPDEHVTQEMCQSALEEQSKALKYFPDQHKT